MTSKNTATNILDVPLSIKQKARQGTDFHFGLKTLAKTNMKSMTCCPDAILNDFQAFLVENRADLALHKDIYDIPYDITGISPIGMTHWHARVNQMYRRIELHKMFVKKRELNDETRAKLPKYGWVLHIKQLGLYSTERVQDLVFFPAKFDQPRFWILRRPFRMFPYIGI